jgi:drug/metabolite transporter (DMT)-like permease
MNEPMSERSRSLLLVHGAAVLFGLAGLFGKLLTLSPLVIVFGRLAFATVALVILAWLWRLPLRPRRRRDLLAFAGVGVGLAVHWILFFQSVQVSSVAVALFTFSTFPVFGALLEATFFRERLRQAEYEQLLLALFGVLILVPSFKQHNQTAVGALYGVASGAIFAGLSLFNRRSVRRYPSLTVALYQDAFALVFLAMLGAIALINAGGYQAAQSDVEVFPSLTLQDLFLLMILGIPCTAVAHAMFIAGLRGVTVRTAGMIVCLEPVYGTVFAVLLLGEEPTRRALGGGLLILAAAFYATVCAGKAAKQQGTG